MADKILVPSLMTNEHNGLTDCQQSSDRGMIFEPPRHRDTEKKKLVPLQLLIRFGLPFFHFFCFLCASAPLWLALLLRLFLRRRQYLGRRFLDAEQVLRFAPQQLERQPPVPGA